MNLHEKLETYAKGSSLRWVLIDVMEGEGFSPKFAMFFTDHLDKIRKKSGPESAVSEVNRYFSSMKPENEKKIIQTINLIEL